MIMTLRALDRYTHNTLTKCFHFIENIFDAIFFRHHATFFSVFMISQERRGKHLLLCCIRYQVASKLPREELVIMHVRIKCMDQPVAPWPLRPDIIILVSV